jgi:hypothetical protein
MPNSALARSGAIMPPIELPVNSTPKPRARSAGGSTRWIVCAAPGKLGPSTTPSAIRNANRTPNPGMTAWSAATTVHASTEPTRPRRAPIRSIHQPDSGVAMR